MLSHGNYAAMMDMIGEVGHIEANEAIYLYLPLAHSYALLIQLAVFELGGTLAYFGGDTKQIVPELMEVKPTYLPSVPRVFEKVYALAQGAIDAQGPEEQERAQAAVALGRKVRDMMVRGEPIPPELQEPFEQAEEGSSKTSARSSVDGCSARPAGPRRSRERSSSSSGPPGCRCSRATE